MKEHILNLLQNSRTLTIEQIVIQTLAAIIIGLVIYLSYWISHVGTRYSKKFNVSLIMLVVLTTTVMAVIGNNVALSLGMVGALSIVRYRTAIKDPRDTAYIFWTIISGICCGAGDLLIAGVSTSAVFLLLLFFGRAHSDSRLLLIIRGARQREQMIESFIYLHFSKCVHLRVKNSTEDSIEMIYEISMNMYNKANNGANSVLDHIYEIGGIEYVNIVAQNDEAI